MEPIFHHPPSDTPAPTEPAPPPMPDGPHPGGGVRTLNPEESPSPEDIVFSNRLATVSLAVFTANMGIMAGQVMESMGLMGPTSNENSPVVAEQKATQVSLTFMSLVPAVVCVMLRDVAEYSDENLADMLAQALRLSRTDAVNKVVRETFERTFGAPLVEPPAEASEKSTDDAPTTQESP